MAARPKAEGIGKASGEFAYSCNAANSHSADTSYSPDPVLTGIQFAQTIQGIQSAGVIACAKHYIAYEQEHFRQAPESAGFGFNINDSISSNLDDITMHELYLW